MFIKKSVSLEISSLPTFSFYRSILLGFSILHIIYFVYLHFCTYQQRRKMIFLHHSFKLYHKMMLSQYIDNVKYLLYLYQDKTNNNNRSSISKSIWNNTRHTSQSESNSVLNNEKVCDSKHINEVKQQFRIRNENYFCFSIPM